MNILHKVHSFLLSRSLTISAAESCTGGLLSSLLTSLPGSSAYFILGTVVYSNRAKTRLLDISPGMLKKHGAVSDPVCRAMAARVRALAKTDFGVGITGIAGPGGAVAGKPAGTVYISVQTPRASTCRRFVFKGSRASVRKQACAMALAMTFRSMKTPRQ